MTNQGKEGDKSKAEPENCCPVTWRSPEKKKKLASKGRPQPTKQASRQMMVRQTIFYYIFMETET